VEQQLYKLTNAIIQLAKVNEIQIDVEAREEGEEEKSDERQYV
jgi:hypothetical protein